MDNPAAHDFRSWNHLRLVTFWKGLETTRIGAMERKLTGIALALVVGSSVSLAQAQGQGEEKGGGRQQPPAARGEGPPQMPGGGTKGTSEQGSPKSGPSAGAKGDDDASPRKGMKEAEPKGSAPKRAGDDTPKQGTPKRAADDAPKGDGKQQRKADTKDDAPVRKDASPKQAAPSDKQAAPGDKSDKQTNEPATRSTDKGGAAKGAESKQPPAAGADKDAPAKQAGSKGEGGRVQVTEEQRTNVGRTFQRQQNINRITQVNFNVSIGTRVPRNTRLVVLPVAIVELVPAYRGYRYFAVEDTICIVDPNSYEIVDVVVISGTTTAERPRSDGRSTASIDLVLTDREKAAIRERIEVGDADNVRIEALVEGGNVPQSVTLRTFSDRVVTEVPKLRGYRYVATGDRIAIVEPNSNRITVLIGSSR